MQKNYDQLYIHFLVMQEYLETIFTVDGMGNHIQNAHVIGLHAKQFNWWVTVMLRLCG